MNHVSSPVGLDHPTLTTMDMHTLCAISPTIRSMLKLWWWKVTTHSTISRPRSSAFPVPPINLTLHSPHALSIYLPLYTLESCSTDSVLDIMPQYSITQGSSVLMTSPYTSLRILVRLIGNSPYPLPKETTLPQSFCPCLFSVCTLHVDA